MEFKYLVPTRIYFGVESIAKNRGVFPTYGKRAFIVTGKASGRVSGALEEITGVLEEIGAEYYIYDRIENNPTPERAGDGGRAAASFKADYVIGIGGGSPLDAAKAVAVLATNDMDPLELYKNVFPEKPLPIIAVPTTAGTGSEVTQYSILTRKDLQFKKSFGNESIFPAAAFLDARYTQKLPYDITVNTAIDALSHALEGYLSKRSTPLTDILAEEAFRLFGECAGSLQNGLPAFEVREKLLYMSMLAGMVIAHTGTTLVHPMGYALTYFKGTPHGRANAYFLKEYLDYNYTDSGAKIERALSLLKLDGVEAFGEVIDRLVGKGPRLSEEEIEKFARAAAVQKSMAYNPRAVTDQDVMEILKKSLW